MPHELVAEDIDMAGCQVSMAVPGREAVPSLCAMGLPTLTAPSARSGTASDQGCPAFSILKGYTRFRTEGPEGLHVGRPPAGPRPERRETPNACAFSLPAALPEDESWFCVQRQPGREPDRGLGRKSAICLGRGLATGLGWGRM
jgi:hypothetical protein